MLFEKKKPPKKLGLDRPDVKDAEILTAMVEHPALARQSQRPLLLTMNCLNGFFHFPYFDSLDEALVQADDKGAIAAVSPSGLSLNRPPPSITARCSNDFFTVDIADSVTLCSTLKKTTRAPALSPSFSPSITWSGIPRSR